MKYFEEDSKWDELAKMTNKWMIIDIDLDEMDEKKIIHRY